MKLTLNDLMKISPTAFFFYEQLRRCDLFYLQVFLQKSFLFARIRSCQNQLVDFSGALLIQCIRRRVPAEQPP